MSNSNQVLLGKWIVELVRQYSKEQKNQNGDKLFIKISGVDEAVWPAVIGELQAAEAELAAVYKPVIRTLSPVAGFERYGCREHETSTWLRNNTAAGHALIIAMTEHSAEAQSLENIFTIDEARLMRTEGLSILYNMLAETYGIYGQELEMLRNFFVLYAKIAEPQLRNVLLFLEAVLCHPEQSMVDNINRNLPQLQLFRDRSLKFSKEGEQRLRKNYQLARLEKDGRSASKEDMIENLYAFLAKEEENGYLHEVWESVEPDAFKEQALSFIHHHKPQFLYYEFEVAHQALSFKIKKQKTPEKLRDFTDTLGTPLDAKQKQILAEALEAIDEGNNPDVIQSFLDEFTQELQENKPLRKELERIAERQRQLHEYTELSEALLQESFRLLEEFSEEDMLEPAQTHFVLKVASKVSEGQRKMLAFHLGHLEKLTGKIHFDAKSLEEAIGEKDKESDVSFQLMLVARDKAIKKKFKLLQAGSGQLAALLGVLEENGHVPYVREYAGRVTQKVDVLAEVGKRVSGYIATEQARGEHKTQIAYDHFVSFLTGYTALLQEIVVHGLGSLDVDALEQALEEVLTGIQTSILARDVYQYVGLLGAIDRLSCQSHEVGYPHERTLTLLNPIRLISYAKRMARLKLELLAWMDGLSEGRLAAGHLSDYIQSIAEATAHLSPVYYVLEGTNDQYLIERQASMGEGVFTLNGQRSGEDQLVDTFAEEFLSTVKTYLEVYPYAKDCLDFVFLYCSHAKYIVKAIDTVLRHTSIRKIKATIHSDQCGAELHASLNGWLAQEESYIQKVNGFPRVEIQIIAEQEINKIKASITGAIQDADIGVLVNYFGQTAGIQYKLEKVRVEPSTDWFETIYKEPMKKDDAVKKISFISEKLPKVLQLFYQLQAVLQTNQVMEPEEHFLLRNVISLHRTEDASLITFMHQTFNWSLFIDRYLDKSLLRNVSSEAQIIKYKSKVGKNKEFRSILSSSKYIRKLVHGTVDHAYYDRLYQKFVVLLKNDHIDRRKLVEAVEKVQEISGGVVLRAIGPGKFAHELMAMYLSTQARVRTDGDALTVWSVCDELPWFHGSQRRPDLVGTRITRDGERIRVHFDLIEMKFIAYGSFEAERYDAIKQVRAGLELYRNRFDFEQLSASAELMRKELVYYLLEFGVYSVEHSVLLKELQDISLQQIDVSFAGAIDTFVYTSNLLERTLMADHQGGYQTELLYNEFVNHIYNRSYILKALGASAESIDPDYSEVEQAEEIVAGKLTFTEVKDEEEGNARQLTTELPSQARTAELDEASERLEERKEIASTVGQIERFDESECIGSAETVYALAELSEARALVAAAKAPSEAVNPEQLALAGELAPIAGEDEDLALLVEGYHRKLRANFHQLGIRITITDTVVGVSVIRIMLQIPIDKPFSSIESRAQEIQLWLDCGPPLIKIRGGKINIDINRYKPAVVYFEAFMQQVRTQVLANELEGRLIAPLGVGQLKEMIYMDFSSPETPHLLIGGRTGSGKSVTINSIILAMMCLYEPQHVQFVFIDPKKVEFSKYKNKRHTLQVIIEIEEAVTMLERLVDEMEQRYARFEQADVNSIDQYNRATGAKLPRLVIVFDEFADFMLQNKSLSSRVEGAITRLGAKARAAGIHLLICTQSPKADIVPTNIRNNLPARLALRATDHHASKIILDEEGAERLGGKGDFLARLDQPDVLRGKSPFLTDSVQNALLKFFNEDRWEG
ncbi:FtsK/SpoIIIE domain-containing protein [Paenibacillus thalictri]|nr:FtsK/SpoIIIE domain-containing protein [Paenibacillus thalictri]